MGFAPEDRLLVLCSRSNLNSEAVTEASYLLQQHLDWEYIIETSIRHAVSPLLFRALKQAAPVPHHVLDQLEALYSGNYERNRRLYRVIEELFAAFETSGIKAMGLKDLQLTWEVYPDIGLRPMGDIDVLIRQEDYEKASRCLASLGFTPLPNPDIPYTLKYAWGHHFRRASDNIWLDLQWNVLQIEWDVCHEGSFDFDVERLWQNARAMNVNGQQVLVPKPEDMLFHLCLHLEGHYYAELVLFSDIVELLRHTGDSFDWSYFIEIVKRYRAESSVYYVLYLVEKLFGVLVPHLGELEPSYFKANIFEALYSNLTGLHLRLDEMVQAVSAPDQVIQKCEVVVRQQVAYAMYIYKALDQLASTFRDRGGHLIIMDGMPSERVFPVSNLDPFQELVLYILDQDWPCLRQVMLDQYFTEKQAPESFRKEIEFQSADPVLAGHPLSVTLETTLVRDIHKLPQLMSSSNVSMKSAAIKVLKSTRQRQATHSTVQVHIMALSPEDLLLYQSIRLAKRGQYRLFGLNALIEFFRSCSAPLDWERITSQATALDATQALEQSLSIASALIDFTPIFPEGFQPTAETPRVLELARYSSASFGQYENLKPFFFFAFSLLSVGGIKAKISYLFQWVVLRKLVRQTFKMLSTLRKKRQLAITDFAYWIEPTFRSVE